MKSKFVFAVIVILTLLCSPLVHGEPIAIKRGTVEGRIQTSSSLWMGGYYYWPTSPGIHFWPEAEFFVLNLQGGFAYFFSPSSALGADFSLNAAGGGGSIITFGVAPFFKYVYGSFFTEISMGFSVLSGSGGGDSILMFQSQLWVGAQISLTESAAFLLGPYFSYIHNFDAEDGTGVAGLRLGVSFFKF